MASSKASVSMKTDPLTEYIEELAAEEKQKNTIG